MTFNKFIIIPLVVCFVLSGAFDSRADEPPPKLKSVPVAVALGMDPIPGDALVYAGKTGQATANILLGIVGGVPFWIGVANLDCDAGEACIGYGVLLIGGALLYIPALIWDGFGGIRGVIGHNENVRKAQSSILHRIQPTFGIANGGGFAGARFVF